MSSSKPPSTSLLALVVRRLRRALTVESLREYIALKKHNLFPPPINPDDKPLRWKDYRKAVRKGWRMYKTSRLSLVDIYLNEGKNTIQKWSPATVARWGFTKPVAAQRAASTAVAATTVGQAAASAEPRTPLLKLVLRRATKRDDNGDLWIMQQWHVWRPALVKILQTFLQGVRDGMNTPKFISDAQTAEGANKPPAAASTTGGPAKILDNAAGVMVKLAGEKSGSVQPAPDHWRPDIVRTLEDNGISAARFRSVQEEYAKRAAARNGENKKDAKL